VGELWQSIYCRSGCIIYEKYPALFQLADTTQIHTKHMLEGSEAALKAFSSEIFLQKCSSSLIRPETWRKKN